MAKGKSAKTLLNEELKAIYIAQNLNGMSSYIDKRGMGIYKKWANNRLKKHGMYATSKALVTDMKGNDTSKKK